MNCYLRLCKIFVGFNDGGWFGKATKGIGSKIKLQDNLLVLLPPT